MEEEIFYQPKAIDNLKNNYFKLIIEKLENSNLNFKKIKRIIILGMGSSYNAGHIGAYYFENISKIQSQVINASEFIDSGKIINENDLVIGITQSGETAETIKALEYAKNKNAKTLAIVEKSISQASIISDVTVNIGSGPEYAVASTKIEEKKGVALPIPGTKAASELAEKMSDTNDGEETTLSFADELKQGQRQDSGDDMTIIVIISGIIVAIIIGGALLKLKKNK